MANLRAETTVIVDHDDMAAIVTESLCRYGSFDELQATIIKENNEGDFVVTLNPKPKEESE